MKRPSFWESGRIIKFPVIPVLLLALLLAAAVPAAKAQIMEDFSVWYYGNGADSGYIARVKYPSGSNDITLKYNDSSVKGDEPYVKNGCTFIGWSLNPDGYSEITPILQGGTVWDPVDVPVTWSGETENKGGFIFYARWDCGSATPSGADVQPDLIISPELTSVAGIPELLISPTPAFPQDGGATPEPVLLIAPDGRASAKNDRKTVNGDELLIAPADLTGTETKKGSVPTLFSTANGDLTPLPATGLTSRVTVRLKPDSDTFKALNMELQIPSLDINSKIVEVKNDEDGYPVEWLEDEVGWLADSVLPGEGVSILAGHNTQDEDTYGPFAMIGSLRIGDRFFIRSDKKGLMIFEVYLNEKINEYDYEELYQACALFENTVTLLTCEDERAGGGYESRRIISAKLVD